MLEDARPKANDGRAGMVLTPVAELVEAGYTGVLNQDNEKRIWSLSLPIALGRNGHRFNLR